MATPPHMATTAGAGHGADPPKTRGSLPVRMFMGPMTKVLNPLIRRGAGRPHFGMAAQIHHRGRRSGRTYITPASARLDGATFWVPLTFGTESDWCRNVRAAGGCYIKWRGREYQAGDPQVIPVHAVRSEIRSVFKAYERVMFRMIGVKHLLRLRALDDLAADSADRRHTA